MSKRTRTIQKIFLFVLLVGTLFPAFIKPAKAVTYQWDYGAIQIRAWWLGGWQFTFQAWAQARSFNPGTDYWRILQSDYWWIYSCRLFSPFNYILEDITYHDEYMSWGWILTGVTYRVKIYNMANPARYIIFDITAKVYAGGGAIVDFEWIKYEFDPPIGHWHFWVEELDYPGLVEDIIGEWWGPGNLPL